jgi:hypothetical protein
VERMFIVVSAHADCAQLFDKGFAIPKLSGHMRIKVMLLLVIVIENKGDRARS